MQVHKEYDILKRLSHSVSVAKPIHRSNDKEEKAVGAPFIVMSYVQVSDYLPFLYVFTIYQMMVFPCQPTRHAEIVLVIYIYKCS